jgi:hypothetical protein
MAIVNTGVRYPIERGGTGTFKSLSTSTGLTAAISSSAPLVITPAKGNAILLTGFIPVVNNGLLVVSVTGSLYGDILTAARSSFNNNAGDFYISSTYSTATIDRVLVNGVAAIQFETDEIVTISATSATAYSAYYTYQEGYIL